MDNVQSELGIDWTNPWISRHVVRSFTRSKKILKRNFNFKLFDSHGGQNSCFQKENKTNVLHKPKQFYLLVEKFPVVANFH